ncbi:hypothetical protein NIES2130_01540 [Scytonema sp. HK-05]|nr:hypothetical protein NIES2130_01540 [Scytonema sp. HK-05]
MSLNGLFNAYVVPIGSDNPRPFQGEVVEMIANARTDFRAKLERHGKLQVPDKVSACIVGQSAENFIRYFPLL